MKTLQIRVARVEDASELLEIYRPYVEKTAISFEYEVPQLEEFENRLKEILKKYPYLVGIYEGRIVGYTYASAFKGRKAYDWSVETTIYMSGDAKGKGFGKQLYGALEELLKQQNVQNVNACIAYTKEENPYLTNGSMYFHEKMGYQLVGTFHKSGRKFEQWYDMIWMEKMIGEHGEHVENFVPFGDLSLEIVKNS